MKIESFKKWFFKSLGGYNEFNGSIQEVSPKRKIVLNANRYSLTIYVEYS